MQFGQEEMNYFLSLYSSTFPEKGHARIVNWDNVSTGWESELLSICVHYEECACERGEHIILKSYYGEMGAKKAKREFKGLKRLAHMGYPVPHVFFTLPPESPFGLPAVTMEKIEGRTFAQVLHNAAQEDQKKLLTQYCQLYVNLHTMDWESFVPRPLEYQRENFIYACFVRARKFIEQWQPPAFDPILKWLEEQCRYVPCPRLSVTHGDFHPDNIILRDDGAMFVLDWTGIDVSDLRFDLGWTLMLLSTQGSAELAATLLQEYENLIGYHLEQMEVFEVVAALRRLFDIWVSLKCGAPMLGMRPGAEEQMRQKAHHIQTVYTLLQGRTHCILPAIERLIADIS